MSWQKLRALLEILGGEREWAVPPGSEWKRDVALGVWWVCLFYLVYFFIGNGVRFLYVDF